MCSIGSRKRNKMWQGRAHFKYLKCVEAVCDSWLALDKDFREEQYKLTADSRDFLLPSYDFLLLYPTFGLVSVILLKFSFWGSMPNLGFSQISRQQSFDGLCFIPATYFREWKAVPLREQPLNFLLTTGGCFLQSECSYGKVQVLCFQPAEGNGHYM